MMKEPVTVEYLRSCVDYDPSTGMFAWKFRADMPKCWNSRFAGKPAFITTNTHGYKEATVLYHKVRAHRAAWAIHYGEWPGHEVDHEDNDKANNRIANLRPASHGQNAMNCVSRAGKSKYLGVYWEKQRSKWRAKIMHEGVSYDLGFFSIEEDAARAYDRAAIALHKEYANPNFTNSHGKENQMANVSGIAIVIKAFLPTGKTLDEQFAALSIVKTAHETSDYSSLLKAASIEEVKTEQKTRRIEDQPQTQTTQDATSQSSGHATGAAPDLADAAHTDLGPSTTEQTPADPDPEADVPAFLKKDKKSKAA